MLPDPFPANSLQAARLAHVGKAEGWIAPFTKAVFAAEFGSGEDISDPAVLAGILTGLGVDAACTMTRSREEEVKDAVREQTVLAQKTGIFGAPTFVTDDGELFWGDDRLEQALAWSRNTSRT